MARKEYIKPRITSDNVFTLTSQACNTTGNPIVCVGNLYWNYETCGQWFYKTISEGSCSPPGPGGGVQLS